MRVTYLFILFIVLQINGCNFTKNRQRRYLIFTPFTQYGVFATVAVPVYLESPVTVAWFFEANYFNVDNATYLEPLLGDATVSRNKDKRSSDDSEDIVTRTSIYLFIENLLEQQGYNGRGCLLRSICEAATSHFLHNGLLGDLLQFTLTPSTTMDAEDLEDSFYEAEYYGLEDNCYSYEEVCEESPLDLISQRVEEITT